MDFGIGSQSIRRFSMGEASADREPTDGIWKGKVIDRIERPSAN